MVPKTAVEESPQ